MAGRAASSAITRYAGIQVQTSSLGLQIPVGWGTFRCKCNLVDYLDFKSTPQKAAAAGKGGATVTGYNYSASIILALCEGPIDAVTQVWVDSKIYAHGSVGSTVADTGSTSACQQVNLTLATGAIGQTPWTYLTSVHPDHAIGYSGLAIVHAENYALDTGASTPSHSFEVVRTAAFGVSGTPDADPSLVFSDFFGNTRTGVPGWIAGLVDAPSLAQYQDYCLAAGLLVSPVIDQQRSASDFLTELLRATNSSVVWSEGLLKLVPYGDTALTGNGKTFTPNLTPVYALDDDDFIVKGSGDAPLTTEIVDQSDAYNVIQLEYLDRTNQYNMAIALASDAANVQQYGMRRKDPDTVHCICTPTVAAISAQLYLQRTLYVRGQYKFTLGWMYALLEPGDIVEVTDAGLGLAAYPIRVTQIDEDEKKATLDLTGEDLLTGVSHAPLYTMQNGVAAPPNRLADPGGVESNLVLASQDFTQGAWTKTQLAVTAAAATDPVYGAAAAQKLIPSTANAVHWTSQAAAVFGAANYTLSGYFAAAGRKRVCLQLASTVSGSAAQFRVGFDLATGQNFLPAYASGGAVLISSSVSAPITVGSETWFRLAITGQLQASDTTANVVVEITDDSGAETWAGDGADGILAYGLQFTQGVDVRAYTPTTTAISGPQIFNAPSGLTGGALETWCAVSGGAFWGGANIWVSLDGGSSYQLVAEAANGGARYGALTASYPAGADPDTGDTLAIDLSASNGALDSADATVADADGTLCLIEGELISFSTATAISPAGSFDLTGYVRRGQLGTAIAAHAAGVPFVRLDAACVALPFLVSQSGASAYVKFQSFNLWGEVETPLQNCIAYAFTPSPNAAAQPGSSAWSASGGVLSNAGQSIPVITVTGACDNPVATNIEFYVRLTGAGAWTPSLLTSRTATVVQLTNIAPNQSYDVGVAYLVGGALTPVQQIASAVTAGAVATSAAAGGVLFDSHISGAWSFACPAGSYGHVMIEAWGADGGEYYAAYFGPGDYDIKLGGSGGYSAYASYAVTPGTSAFGGTIGATGFVGGASGTGHSGASGAGGGTTVTTPAISTNGGGAATSSAGGAAGAAGSGGTTNTAGASGRGVGSNGRVRITALT